jgi:pyrroloquinoline-quinone synthase
MGAPDAMPWSRAEFEQKLRAKGKRYHIYHPYQVAMNSGRLTKDQIQGWVYNRYYYQISIPIKDAAVLSNMPDREHRRQWIQRIIDHDGTQGDEGGIEAWIWLGQACGLQREDVTSLKYVLPGVRFAVDAYVSFARRPRSIRSGCRTGRSTTRGSTHPATPISASACPRRGATWSTVCM